MSLLDSWMPSYEFVARYQVAIAAPPSTVYATLLATDFSRPWMVRALMGARLLPALIRSPARLVERFRRGVTTSRASLADLAHSDFVLLEQAPPREIVLGITGRFWTLTASVIPIGPDRFLDSLPAGLAQAAWNFEVSTIPAGAELATETRIRCADPLTLGQFRRYWRLVAPGSGLIRRAILRQVRREVLLRRDRAITDL